MNLLALQNPGCFINSWGTTRFSRRTLFHEVSHMNIRYNSYSAFGDWPNHLQWSLKSLWTLIGLQPFMITHFNAVVATLCVRWVCCPQRHAVVQASCVFHWVRWIAFVLPNSIVWVLFHINVTHLTVVSSCSTDCLQIGGEDDLPLIHVVVWDSPSVI